LRHTFFVCETIIPDAVVGVPGLQVGRGYFL